MDEVALLEGLLAVYSPTHGESEAVAYLVAQMQALGFDTRVDEAGNAIGTIGSGPDEVVLLGHIDTVAGFIQVRLDGERLHGRGAVDAKGPLACFVAAAARAGRQPGRRLTVIGAVGEEGDSRGAKYIVGRHKPQALIIGEPSGWDRVTLGYKGSAWFEFEARRTLAHTSAQAQSACEAAIVFWNGLARRVSDYNDGRTKMFDQLLPTLRGMQSDSDGFVETAKLKFGMRLPLGLSVADLGRLVEEAASADHVEFLDGCPAYRAEKNTPLVRAFLAAIRAESGEPAFSVKSGTSDMNLVGPVWQCPTLAYGPGDSALDHTPDEHILVPEYRRAVRILAQVLKNERLL
jgi:LysW-gamma-L-lysine carboxypeptidase